MDVNLITLRPNYEENCVHIPFEKC
jgi:hypothetical protein